MWRHCLSSANFESARPSGYSTLWLRPAGAHIVLEAPIPNMSLGDKTSLHVISISSDKQQLLNSNVNINTSTNTHTSTNTRNHTTTNHSHDMISMITYFIIKNFGPMQIMTITITMIITVNNIN